MVATANKIILTKEQTTKIKDLLKYANDYNVPIIEPDGIEFIIKLINDNNYKEVLELGTAIAYSAINMALYANAFITTIERDPLMYKEAVKNVSDLNLDNNINLVFKDALESFELVNDKLYDVIFIDAAKGQYERFFNMYKSLLKPGGIIVTDNLKFHGLVNSDNIEGSRNLKALVRKIKNYVSFLENNEEYETIFYDIADGMSVTRKK